MPIPDAENAEIPKDKICRYLLNLRHPSGGSKAVWFHHLGYTIERWQELGNDLLKVARNCQTYTAEQTRYGVKYRATGWLGRNSLRPGHVMTVWMINSHAPRFITAYPIGAR